MGRDRPRSGQGEGVWAGALRSVRIVLPHPARPRRAVPPHQGREGDQTACKPGSVPPLAGRGGHSSGPTLAGRFSRPTRTPRSGDAPTRQYPCGLGRRGIPIRSCSWRGLPCGPCYQEPGALLPHPFTLTLSEEKAVCSLWRYPWGHPRRALPAAMSSWSPDFPRPPKGPRPPGRLIRARHGVFPYPGQPEAWRACT
jgi:hypothetical protein